MTSPSKSPLGVMSVLTGSLGGFGSLAVPSSDGPPATILDGSTNSSSSMTQPTSLSSSDSSSVSSTMGSNIGLCTCQMEVPCMAEEAVSVDEGGSGFLAQVPPAAFSPPCGSAPASSPTPTPIKLRAPGASRKKCTPRVHFQIVYYRPTAPLPECSVKRTAPPFSKWREL